MNRRQATNAFSQNVVPFPNAPSRAMVFEPPHAWHEAVNKRLGELVGLERGWDGYGAEPVSFENAVFAIRMLEVVCGPDAITPQLVPGPAGDLQIEWHTLTGDIELHVRSPNNVHAWRQLVGVDGQGEELELTNEFSKVSAWIRDLTRPDLAVATAAA